MWCSVKCNVRAAMDMDGHASLPWRGIAAEPDASAWKMPALITKTWEQTAKALIGEDKAVRDSWAFIAILVMFFSAVFFPFHEYGHRNIIISFVAGFITGGVWIALTVGPLVLWCFLIYLFWSLLDVDKKITIKRSKVPGNVCVILAGIITIAAWIAVSEFFKNVPVVGEQITFMFQDFDDDDDD